MRTIHKSSEHKIIQNFIGNSENTMNSVVSNSIGMAILNLYKKYFAEGYLDDYFEKTIKEIKRLAPAFADKACSYLELFANQPVSQLDSVTLFFAKQPNLATSSGKHKRYEFPLKIVITLVWRALNNDQAYQQHIDLPLENEIRYQEVVKKNRMARLESFYNCIEAMRRNQVCHHGKRNELFFLLNKIHPGVDLLEDIKSSTLHFLKDNLMKKFSEAYEFSDKNTQKKLIEKVLVWICEANPVPFINFVDPEDNLRKSIHIHLMNHGSNPKKVGLDNLIDEAYSSLEFSCDPIAHKTLYNYHLVFRQFSDKPNQIQEQKNALQVLQGLLKKNETFEDVTSTNALALFCSYYQIYEEYKENRIDLSMSCLLTDRQRELIEYIENYFKNFDIKNLNYSQANECWETEIQLLVTNIGKAKLDNMRHQIENFFWLWFDAIKRNSFWFTRGTGAVELQYTMLLESGFQKKVLLSDEDIEAFYQTQNDGILDINPYLINRIFLHALIVSPPGWSEKFGKLLATVYGFVKTQFNEDTKERAIQLKTESYPAELLDQILYQLEYYRDISENRLIKKYRPPSFILLPKQVGTAKEWITISCYFRSQTALQNAYQPYSILINRLLFKAIKEHGWMFEECVLSLPRQSIGLFIKQYGEIINIIDTRQLLILLELLAPGQRLNLIQKLGSKLVAHVQNLQNLQHILSYFQINEHSVILEILGLDLLTIIEKQMKKLLAEGDLKLLEKNLHLAFDYISLTKLPAASLFILNSSNDYFDRVLKLDIKSKLVKTKEEFKRILSGINEPYQLEQLVLQYLWDVVETTEDIEFIFEGLPQEKKLFIADIIHKKQERPFILMIAELWKPGKGSSEITRYPYIELILIGFNKSREKILQLDPGATLFEDPQFGLLAVMASSEHRPSLQDIIDLQEAEDNSRTYILEDVLRGDNKAVDHKTEVMKKHGNTMEKTMEYLGEKHCLYNGFFKFPDSRGMVFKGYAEVIDELKERSFEPK